MFQCEDVSVMVPQVMHPLPSPECPLRRLGASSRILQKVGWLRTNLCCSSSPQAVCPEVRDGVAVFGQKDLASNIGYSKQVWRSIKSLSN